MSFDVNEYRLRMISGKNGKDLQKIMSELACTHIECLSFYKAYCRFPTFGESITIDYSIWLKKEFGQWIK